MLRVVVVVESESTTLLDEGKRRMGRMTRGLAMALSAADSKDGCGAVVERQ